MNGHVLNAAACAYPDPALAFCNRCGSPALSACPACGAPIRGEYHVSGTLTLTPYELPAYCIACGAIYPWTEARVIAAIELADALEQLTPQERAVLKAAILEVTCDGRSSTVAIGRMKRLLGKAGEAAAQSLQSILTDIVTEAVGKALWGPTG